MWHIYNGRKEAFALKFVKKPWVIPIILTILILAVGGFLLKTIWTDEEPLTEEAIQAKLIKLYGGEVGKLSKDGNTYYAELKKNGVVIEAQIDAITGNVLSLNQVSAAPPPKPEILSEDEVRKQISKKYNGELKNITLKEDEKAPIYQIEVSHQQTLTSLTVDALSGKVIEEVKKETSPPEQQQVLISKEQAIQIAHGRMKGEVDYITYEQTDDGGYYLLEIDGEEDEAVFQIHAISGEIISVTNDDEDKEDEDE